eukprot:4574625-Lingulodinium_polyedra.AAC.1
MAPIASSKARRLATTCATRGLVNQRTLQLSMSVATQLRRWAANTPEGTDHGTPQENVPTGPAGRRKYPPPAPD